MLCLSDCLNQLPLNRIRRSFSASPIATSRGSPQCRWQLHSRLTKNSAAANEEFRSWSRSAPPDATCATSSRTMTAPNTTTSCISSGIARANRPPPRDHDHDHCRSLGYHFHRMTLNSSFLHRFPPAVVALAIASEDKLAAVAPPLLAAATELVPPPLGELDDAAASADTVANSKDAMESMHA